MKTPTTFKIEDLRDAANQTATKHKAEALAIAREGDPGEIVANAELVAKLDDAAQAEVMQAIRTRGFKSSEFSIADMKRAIKAKRIMHRQQQQRAPRKDKRHEVMLGPDEHRVNNEIIKSLAERDRGIYHRGGALVRIVTTEDEADGGVYRSAGSHKIGEMPPANLRERISEHAVLIVVDSEGIQHEAHPPDWTARGIHARGEWPALRFLKAISDAPFLRPDGTVCTTPGYDAASRVYLTPGGVAGPIPDKPTLADAEAARDRLLELVADFCFEGEPLQQDEYKAAWLAGLLTPFARQAFTGPGPLFLVDANTPGAGKTKLPTTAGRVFLGRQMPTAGYSHDSTEMGKRITAIARDADQVVLLDNIAGSFGNEALDRALTSTAWKERILGQTAQVDAPLLATWWATANNVEMVGDTIRRVLHIRLNVATDHPEDRSGPTEGKAWRFPDLDSHVAKNYKQYRADALTILAGYCAAGRPVERVKPFGSFEGWSALVRQAVLWAGCADPCDTRRRLAETSDTQRATLGDLLAAWHEVHGDTPKRIAEVLETLYPGGKRPEGNATPPTEDRLREAIEATVSTPPGRVPTAKQLGVVLRGRRDRVVDGLAFVRGDDMNRLGVEWSASRVEAVTNADPKSITAKKQALWA